MLFAEWRSARWLVWLTKPIASLGFVAAALSSGALESTYGVWVLVALSLCLAGDVLLIAKKQAVFLGGILAFLAGHLAFAVAFVVRGLSPTWTVTAALVVALLGVAIGPRIAKHAPVPLRGAVSAYIVVLSAMVALAFGAYGLGGGALLPVAAVAFYVSDLSVAIDRFVRPGIANKLWGAPLYFTAAHLFARTVAGPWGSGG